MFPLSFSWFARGVWEVSILKTVLAFGPGVDDVHAVRSWRSRLRMFFAPTTLAIYPRPDSRHTRARSEGAANAIRMRRYSDRCHCSLGSSRPVCALWAPRQRFQFSRWGVHVMRLMTPAKVSRPCRSTCSKPKFASILGSDLSRAHYAFV